MKMILTLLLSLMMVGLQAQTNLLSDNFESGSGNWTLTNGWGLSTVSSNSSSHSLTESPTGNYSDNITSMATLTTGVNLSSALNADLSFWAKYVLEGGFDYMYLEVSPNGGTTWVQLDSFDDTLANWTKFSYSLGGYVGNSNVKIRFKFVSDGAVNFDGMYIDDVEIYSDTTDNSEPLILHNEPSFYSASLNTFPAIASIIDISGLSYTKCFYTVDGGSLDSVSYSSLVGNTYTFPIPAQQPGAHVDYYFIAIDSAPAHNAVVTQTYHYIQGNYISYDNAVTNFVDSTAVGGGAAVRITLAGPVQLTTILLRNYIDVNRDNDSMLIHVWANNNGVPGTDLITPFKVFPWATLQNTSPMTVVDLRSDSLSLTGLTGDIFIGFTVPVGGVWTTITQPGTGGRSFKYSTSGWAINTNTDFHFRAITSGLLGLPTANFTYNNSAMPQISFQDSSLDATSWSWNFGDGSPLSNLQNPSHAYTHNGIFNVCLIAGNLIGTDTICKYVTINSFPTPVSAFIYDDSQNPTIQFTDQSTQSPLAWSWHFGYNGMTSGQPNPSFTYPNATQTYQVCLTAANLNGIGDTSCQTISILSDGLNEIEAKYVNIFPNPMTEKALFKININTNKALTFNLYDASGKLIQADIQVVSEGILLKRGSLSAGNYLFEIIQEGQKHSGKIIVQ
jgi:PKD repeat protein